MGTESGILYSLSLGMMMRWQANLGAAVRSIPAASADAIYVASGDWLQAYHPHTGELLWVWSLAAGANGGSGRGGLWPRSLCTDRPGPGNCDRRRLAAQTHVDTRQVNQVAGPGSAAVHAGELGVSRDRRAGRSRTRECRDRLPACSAALAHVPGRTWLCCRRGQPSGTTQPSSPV